MYGGCWRRRPKPRFNFLCNKWYAMTRFQYSSRRYLLLHFLVHPQTRGAAQASLVSKNMQDASMTEAEKDCLKWAASSLFSGKMHILFSSFVSHPGFRRRRHRACSAVSQARDLIRVCEMSSERWGTLHLLLGHVALP
jgi:hypothetical protein